MHRNHKNETTAMLYADDTFVMEAYAMTNKY